MTGALCFLLGLGAGIWLSIEIANHAVKHGTAFFNLRGQWYGDRDAIIRMMAKRRDE